MTTRFARRRRRRRLEINPGVAERAVGAVGQVGVLAVGALEGHARPERQAVRGHADPVPVLVARLHRVEEPELAGAAAEQIPRGFIGTADPQRERDAGGRAERVAGRQSPPR